MYTTFILLMVGLASAKPPPTPEPTLPGVSPVDLRIPYEFMPDADNVEFLEGKIAYFDCNSKEKPIWMVTTIRGRRIPSNTFSQRKKYSYKKCTHFNNTVVHTLIVKNIAFSDEGSYECQVANKIKANYVLTVKMSIEGHHKVINTTVGNNVSLLKINRMCDLTFNNNARCIKCYHISEEGNQVLLNEGPSSKDNRYSLIAHAPHERRRRMPYIEFIITNVTVKDSGWYSCVDVYLKEKLGVAKLVVT